MTKIVIIKDYYTDIIEFCCEVDTAYVVLCSIVNIFLKKFFLALLLLYVT